MDVPGVEWPGPVVQLVDKFGQAVCKHGEAGICLEWPCAPENQMGRHGVWGAGRSDIPAKARMVAWCLPPLLFAMLVMGLWNAFEPAREEKQQEQRIEDFLDQCLEEPVAGCPGPPGPSQ